MAYSYGIVFYYFNITGRELVPIPKVFLGAGGLHRFFLSSDGSFPNPGARKTGVPQTPTARGGFLGSFLLQWLGGGHLFDMDDLN